MGRVLWNELPLNRAKLRHNRVSLLLTEEPEECLDLVISSAIIATPNECWFSSAIKHRKAARKASVVRLDTTSGCMDSLDSLRNIQIHLC
jgi:hypothetical protein